MTAPRERQDSSVMTKKTEGTESATPFELKKADDGRAVFFRHHPPGFTHIRWEIEKDKGLEGENAAEVVMPTSVLRTVSEGYLQSLMQQCPERLIAGMARAILSEPLADMVGEWAKERKADSTLKKLVEELKRRREAKESTQDLPESD